MTKKSKTKPPTGRLFRFDDDEWRRAAWASDGPLPLVGRTHVALHAPAQRITGSGADLDALVERMSMTLFRARGYALSACQVGFPFNLIVVADPSGQQRPVGFVNVSVGAVPITVLTGSTTPTEPAADTIATEIEGCLSRPGRWYRVPRRTTINVTAARAGFGVIYEPGTFTAVGMAARMWQHETDHLAGRLISDEWPESPSAAIAESPAALARMTELAEAGS